ncbi:Uncharacterized protein APZ42_003511 [Daphnia magna]|uniref:Uncharacterized protein n=1 Tax=Daphnia magna TaxID=35525 RepID=A0A164HHX2_9CRUS|nr:Uncharacterized protein APZ42_003511 [Daphnia magna]
MCFINTSTPEIVGNCLFSTFIIHMQCRRTLLLCAIRLSKWQIERLII